MAMIPFPLEQPGVAGLNKEGRNTVLGPEWATKVQNLIIDEEGRLALRRGTKARTVANLDSAVEVTWSLRSGAGGVQQYCATVNGTVYQMVAGAWLSLVTSLPDGNVQFANVDGLCHFVHAGVALPYRQAVSGGAFATIASARTGAKACAGMFGRLWLLYSDEVQCSDAVLITNGTYSPAVKLAYAFGEGGGEGVALAEFNGNIVIFGAHSIAIYKDPLDPFGTTFEKIEAIVGVGCLHRDSIQNIGRDMLFLSSIGMRTLGRVIQEKSNPITDAAPQVRDFVLEKANSSTLNRIKSAFVPSLGLYVLTVTGTTLVFDTRRQLSNGAMRVVEWDSAFAAPGFDNDDGLMLCQGPMVYKYEGVLDFVSSTGVGGETIEGEYEGGWLDFSQIADGAGPLLKTLKKLHMTFTGGNASTITYKWTTDYLPGFQTATTVVTTPPGGSFFGGTAFFGAAQDSTFGKAIAIVNKTKNISRTGRVIKIGFKVQNSTSTFAVNRMDVFAKIGKLST